MAKEVTTFINDGAANTKPAKQHNYSLDWLRVYLVLLGFPFHAWTLNNPGFFWYRWFRNGHPFNVNSIIWISHLFRVQLFMLIAGYVFSLTSKKRNFREIVSKRFHRILVPWLLGVIFIVPELYALRFYAYKHFYHQPVSLLYCLHRQLELVIHGRSMMGYMWFLLYLYLITFVFAAMREIYQRLIKKLQANGIFTSGPRFPTPILFWSSLVLFALLFTLILKNTVYWADIGMPFIEAWKPQFQMFNYYFLVFVIGVALNSNKELEDEVARNSVICMALAAISICVLFFEISHFQGSFQTNSIVTWQLRVLVSIASLLLTIGTFGIARRFFNRPNVHIKTISDASYSIYITHEIFVYIVGAICLILGLTFWSRVTITAVTAMILCGVQAFLFYRPRQPNHPKVQSA